MRALPGVHRLRLLAVIVGGLSSISLAGASDIPLRAGVASGQKSAVVVPARSVAERSSTASEAARRDRAAAVLTAMAEPPMGTFDAPYSWQGQNQRPGAEARNASSSQVADRTQGLQPGPWSAILSTVLLGVFFLFRRMT